jgi:hypothetical protein
MKEKKDLKWGFSPEEMYWSSVVSIQISELLTGVMQCHLLV